MGTLVWGPPRAPLLGSAVGLPGPGAREALEDPAQGIWRGQWEWEQPRRPGPAWLWPSSGVWVSSRGMGQVCGLVGRQQGLRKV